MNADDTEELVNLADEWLTEHRVSESWRMISALRDGLVRQVDASRPFTEEDVEAAARVINMRNAPILGQTPGVDYESWELDLARAALDAVTARRAEK